MLRTPPRVPSAPALPTAKPLAAQTPNPLAAQSAKPLAFSSPIPVATPAQAPVPLELRSFEKGPSERGYEIQLEDIQNITDKEIPEDLRVFIRGGTLTQMDLTKFINYLRDTNPQTVQLQVNRERTIFVFEAEKKPRERLFSHIAIRDQIVDDFEQNPNNPNNPNNPHLFIYPVHVNGDHWILVVVDKQKRTIESYNSMPGHGNPPAGYFNNTIAELNRIHPGPSYRFENKVTTKLQHDGVHCGGWVLYFAQRRVVDAKGDFNITQGNMEKFRRVVAQKLTFLQRVSDVIERANARRPQ